ncbi:hypothetical protein V8E54_007507 [Elaphomyces granulatus]
MDKISFQIGVAGLGIGVFSGALDLLDALKKTYEIWRGMKELDCDLGLLQAKLLLQQELLEKWQRDWYGFALTGKESIRQQRLLKQHDDAVRTTLGAVSDQLERLQPLQDYAQGKSKLTPAERIRWFSGQMDESSRILVEVDSLLAGLYRLLPPRNPNIEAIQMITILDPENSHSASLDDVLRETIIRNSPLTFRTFELKRFENSLAIDLEKRVNEFKEQMPKPGKRIQAVRVKVVAADEITVGGRSFGLLDDEKPVVIEWKRYDGTWRGQKGIKMRGRIDNLARMLGADTRPEELLTLRCLGYFDEPSSRRYGFVSDVSALKALIDYPSAESLPSLEDRYQIAYALGLSLAILHTAEWLHKSIRSHNVLFPSSNHGIAWTRPYLVGFEYSRPDHKDASSEKPADSARFNLYRHPSCQGTPLDRYRREFDIYSFGVLLVEIGTWTSAWKLWDERCAATKFREDLIRLTREKMAHYMGVEYRDAALKCLTDELSNRSESILKAFFVEVVEVLRRCIEAR